MAFGLGRGGRMGVIFPKHCHNSGFVCFICSKLRLSRADQPMYPSITTLHTFHTYQTLLPQLQTIYLTPTTTTKHVHPPQLPHTTKTTVNHNYQSQLLQLPVTTTTTTSQQQVCFTAVTFIFLPTVLPLEPP